MKYPRNSLPICRECKTRLEKWNWVKPRQGRICYLCFTKLSREAANKYASTHLEERKQRWKNWRAKNDDYYRNWNNRRFKLVRLDVLVHYGGNPPKCACCGEMRLGFLSFDHINGHRNSVRERWEETWGYDRRHKARHKSSAHALITAGYPKDIQILCFNCNAGKQWNHGICPHKEVTLLDKLYAESLFPNKAN